MIAEMLLDLLPEAGKNDGGLKVDIGAGPKWVCHVPPKKIGAY